jgi:ATP-binding cassette, subfamily B, heavy metal transporter
MHIQSSHNDKEDIIKYSTWEMIRDIGDLLKPYRRNFILASFVRLTGDLANLYPAYALASIVTILSKYQAGIPLGQLWAILGLWTLASAWRNIGKHLSKYLNFQISERVSLDAQLKTIRHLFSLDMAWHEKENAGNRLKRIQKGGDGLDRILRMWTVNFIEIVVNFIGMIFILSRTDKLIGSAIVIYLFLYFIFSFMFLKRASAASQSVDIKEEEVMGLMFQAINNIRSVKVLALGRPILQMINGQTKNLFAKIRHRIFCFQSRSAMLEALSIFFRLGSISLIVIGIAKGHFEVGFLLLFNGYFNSLSMSVDELSAVTQDLIVYKYSIARMQRTLNEPILIDDKGNKIDFPKRWSKISIRNLSFSYGKNKALKDISFDIKRGERVGIIGLSGAGKSTLFKLLLKENENFGGDILFDGTSIRTIKPSSYFEQVGIVLQDTEVFNFSLRDNITIASSKKFDAKKLENALNIAHVSDYVHKLPDGIDTYIGEKGVKLSGGEKQRLGIARAIYKQPQILLLDEATSHLDLESEQKIKQSLQYFFKNITAIIIAHRLTTIREMDKIVVIEGGSVIEFGSFEELYKKKGRLYELWGKQKLQA